MADETEAPDREPPTRRYIPVVWRVFAVNAAILAVMGVVTVVRLPLASLSTPVALVQELPILTGALALMLVVNLLLLRRTLSPLEELMDLMRRVDPLKPGERVSLDQRRGSEATELAESFNEMLERLETEREESTRRALAAQESERLRVAQELHDEIGQGLTAALLQIGRAQGAAPPELRAELEAAQQTVQANFDEVRRIARRLRPEALDEMGLVNALSGFSERIAEQAGLRISRRLDPALPALSYEQELVIYRVAQEALTNVVRHAEAGNVELSLTAAGDVISVRVTDDGRGLEGDAPMTGGIRGMYERALLIDAALTLDRGAAGGTEVRLDVPVAPWAPVPSNAGRSPVT